MGAPHTRKGKRYWYRIHVGECPVCGRNRTFRERVYGEPPRERSQRHVYLPDCQTYCGCLDR
jgi:hypothetical protein